MRSLNKNESFLIVIIKKETRNTINKVVYIANDIGKNNKANIAIKVILFQDSLVF